MKLFTSSLLVLLTRLSIHAQAQSTFEEYHAKAIKSAPVSLTDSSFDEVASKPRNHSLAVCLTALDPRHKCGMCVQFKPEWDALAKSWTKGDKQGKGRVLFATLDVKEGRDTFQALGLETAPVVLLFLPTIGPHGNPSVEPKRYDFTTGLPTSEMLHSWISRQLPSEAPKPAFRRPPNYIRIAATTTFGVGALTAVTVAWPYVQIVIQNRNLWAAGCLIAILLFTSGHMFNHIRGAPYVGPDEKGGIQYFAPGFQNQFGLESQIVAGIYAVLAFGTLALALKVPRMQSAKSQQAAVFIWSAMVYLVYGFLMNIFRTKNQGYPFRLPPF